MFRSGEPACAFAGGTQTATPGSLSEFTLKVPKILEQVLKKLSHRKGVTVTVTARATSQSGAVITDTTTVEVPGRR